MSLYDLTVNTLGGAPQPLAGYKGKVALVVNTASECGFTPQYSGLQSLYEKLQSKGFVILGFPSNDFGAQEPGSAEQIQNFCQKNYGVTFPLFEKIATKGAAQSPVFKLLAEKHGAPKWNFHKYLVGKNGEVRAAFPSNVAPDDKTLAAAIDAALKE
ncbi:MAG TPA: glutathione peroxidase [Polyangia bacterium]|nr:glutathione peroxidase [Polyangia bacterium]